MMTCRRCRQTVLAHAQRTHRCPGFYDSNPSPSSYPTFDPTPATSYSSSDSSSSSDSYSGGGGDFGGGGASGDW